MKIFFNGLIDKKITKKEVTKIVDFRYFQIKVKNDIKVKK